MKKQLALKIGVCSVRPGFDYFRSSELSVDNSIQEASVGTCQYYTINKTGRCKFVIEEDDDTSCVCVVPIRGYLFPHTYYSSLDEYKKIIDLANRSEKIKAVVLLIDSPGGMISGVSDLAEYINKVSKNKPVYAVVDGMCCSAAYWLASSCRAIYATNTTTEFGSIGVMSTFVDDRLSLRRSGYRRIELYSTLSPDKNRVYEDVLDGKSEEYITKHLDPLASIFRAYVKSKRSTVSESAMSGEVYFATEAQSLGLVDEIVCMDDIISRILYNVIDMNILSNVTVALGVESLESDDHGAYLSLEQLARLDEALATTGTSAAASSNPVVGPDQIAHLEQRIAKLESLPAANGGGANISGDFQSAEDWNYINNSK